MFFHFRRVFLEKSFGFLLPLLISVEDFAFRGRPVSLLVAALLWGLTCLAFPAGVFVFHSNQQLERLRPRIIL
jgi:hypothetical protein